MNYREFRENRTELLRHNSELLDLGETNLYAALSHLSVAEPDNAMGSKVHRCHLAEDWIRVQGLPRQFVSRAFVSAGVRDSLTTLFAHYASLPYSAWLPSDNYPVFHKLAQDAGLEFEEFSTLGGVSLPTKGRELLLLTNPMKPVGRYLSDGEVETLAGCFSQASPIARYGLFHAVRVSCKYPSLAGKRANHCAALLDQRMASAQVLRSLSRT